MDNKSAEKFSEKYYNQSIEMYLFNDAAPYPHGELIDLSVTNIL